MSTPRGYRSSLISAVVLALCSSWSCRFADPVAPVRRTVEQGVEVVLSDRPSWVGDEAWRLGAEPEVAIGEDTDDGRYLFSFVVGPVRLADGRIVAGDERSREIRFYAADGRFEHAAGRAGEGPGELGILAGLMRCGRDTLYAIDGARYEINVVDAEGAFGRRDPFEINAGISLYLPLHCNGKGQILGMDFGDQLVTRREGLYRNPVHMWLLDPRGFPLRDFGEFPGIELVGFAGRTSRHPFGKQMVRALADDRAYIGAADDFDIEVWSLEGAPLRRIRRAGATTTVTDVDVDRDLASAAERLEAESLERRRQILLSLDRPAAFPAYERLLVDAAEHLWAEHFRRPAAAYRTWSIFDPEGVWLGDLDVPSGFEITEVGSDYALGIFRNELDDESIRLYRLIR